MTQPHCSCPYSYNRHSRFVCDSIWLLAGVTPALLPLARESLCSSSTHDRLSQAPEPNPQQLSVSVSRHGEPCVFLPHHTTHVPAQACSLPTYIAATLIDVVALLCHLPERRVGKSDFTPTFTFLNTSIVLFERRAQDKHLTASFHCLFLHFPHSLPGEGRCPVSG